MQYSLVEKQGIISTLETFSALDDLQNVDEP